MTMRCSGVASCDFCHRQGAAPFIYHNEIVVLVLEMEVMEARKGVMEARIEV